MAKKRRQAAVNGGEADPATVKRRRQYTEQDARLADIYQNLADEVESVRIKAATALVHELSCSNGASQEFVEKTINRLIKGLCSSRKAARLGFFIALTEVLDLVFEPETSIPKPDLTLDGLVKLITQLTQPETNESSQEKRDYLLGRLSGYAAVIQSSILFKSSTNIDSWSKVLDIVYMLARDTPWLREQAGFELVNALKAIAKQAADSGFIKELVAKLVSNGLAMTPEGVAIWLTVRSTFPNFDFPDDVWRENNPLCKKQRKTLRKVLTNNYRSAEEKDSPGSHSGTPQRKVNFAWIVVVDTVITKVAKAAEESRSPAGRVDFREFKQLWVELIDETLFAEQSTRDRKSWGFQLLTHVIKNGPGRFLCFIFTPNLMRCLINQWSDSERYLHDTAKVSLNAIIARVKHEPDIASDMLSGLLMNHSDTNLDQLTKTKVIETVVTLASEKSLPTAIGLLRGSITTPGSNDQKTADARRRVFADLLIVAIKEHSKELELGTPSTGIKEWLESVISELVGFGYFNPPAPYNGHHSLVRPPVSENTRSYFQARLLSCLTFLLTSQADKSFECPYYAISAFENLDKNYEDSHLALQADKDIWKRVKKAHRALEGVAARATSASESERVPLLAFKLLYSFAILQVYSGDTDAVAMLDDIDLCYQSSAISAKSEDTPASELIIQIVLTFASKPSVLFRTLATEVFRTFCSEIAYEGLESLLDILEKPEDLEGQEELFDRQDVEMDEVSKDDELNEIGSDVEVLDTEEGAEEESEESETDAGVDDNSPASDKDDDSGEESAEEEDEQLMKLDADLAQLLQTRKPAADDADTSSSGSDMDDEQMEAMDEALSNVFKQRLNQKPPSQKKEKKDAKETMINFKNRVLDLLIIFVKQRSTDTLTLEIILPCLKLIRTTTRKQVAERTADLLKQYFDATKRAKPHNLTGTELSPLQSVGNADILAAIAERVHDEAAKWRPDANGKLHSGACSRSSLFLAKAMLAQSERNYRRIADIYAGSQEKCLLDPECRIQTGLFLDWTNFVNERIAARRKKMVMNEGV